VNNSYFKVTDDWCYYPHVFTMAAGGVGYGYFRMAIYSPQSGFYGSARLTGVLVGGGAGFADLVLTLPEEWQRLPVRSAFSAAQLNGAPGSVGVPWTIAFVVAAGGIYGSARKAGGKTVYFENAPLSAFSGGFGAMSAFMRGQWNIRVYTARDPRFH